MSIQIIQERLTSYNCKSALEEEQALREITQEIALAGLGRTDFFRHAGFQGGTCLRIFHSLYRFSEDMDFALLGTNKTFSLSPYLDQMKTELQAFGYHLEIDDRSHAEETVKKAFVKDDSVGKLLNLRYHPETGPMRKIRIKLEVDTNPPEGASYSLPTLDYPFPSAVRIFDLPSLFAGKIHALLCRNYLKGRDWYDFIWYTARRTPINHQLLSAALNQHGPWKDKNISTDSDWCTNELNNTITNIDWNNARLDVQRFLKQQELPSLELWTQEYFLNQCRKLKEPSRRE